MTKRVGTTMAKKFDLGYYCSEGVHSIFTHGFMSFAAVCMIVACLLIMGSFSLVAVNLDNMLGDLEAENIFLAYVDETYTEEQSRALQSEIEAVPNVSDVTFVTKGEAMEDYKAGRENNPLVADLPDEVLRDRFEIHVKDIEQMEAAVEQVKLIPGIVNTRAALDIAQGFVTVRNIAAGVAIVLVSILAVVSLFIIANTTKLAFFYRREEIAIMRMVGATNGFIRWPFVYEGFMLGLLGAVIAFFLQWALYAAVARGVDSNDTLQLIQVMPFSELWAPVAAVFALAGIVIGVGGSLSAIRKFLQV